MEIVDYKYRRKSLPCSARNCSNKCIDQTLFPFPTETEQCLKWLLNSHRHDLLDVHPDIIRDNHCLCSSHFDSSQFDDDQRKNLKPNAIPTIFEFSSSSSSSSDSNKPFQEISVTSQSIQVINKSKDNSSLLNCTSQKSVKMDFSAPGKGKFGLYKERFEEYLPSNVPFHKSRQYVYRCFECDRAFAYKWNLKRHMKIHNAGAVPLFCDVCNEKFPGFRGFTQHMYTHIGEKPFSCNICKEKFSRSSMLREHLIDHIGYVPA